MTDDVFKRLQEYVGTPYVSGVFDCWDLAAKVQREVFGRETAVPAHRDRPQGAAGQRREIFNLRDEVAIRVDVPFTGCLGLFFEPGAFAPIWHIGVGAIRLGEIYVLHNSEKLGGAHFQRLNDLQRFGMRLEGWYACK